MSKPRPNVKDPNVELRHRLTRMTLNPQPTPMNLAESMAHDLKVGDKVAKIALGFIAVAAAAFVFVGFYS